jgi:murein DD-endopeptidase MepM/ murein hydrolase activator NlpD
MRGTPRSRLVLLAGLAALVAATPALGTSPAAQKQRVDARRAQLGGRIESARQRASALSAEIRSTNAQIAGLERRVGDVSARLVPLERDLALHRRRLAALNALLGIQTRRLHELQRERAITLHRLSLHMVEVYESTPPGLLGAVLTSSSLGDLVNQVEVTRTIALQDRQIIHAVTRSRNALRAARRHTRRIRAQVSDATKQVAFQAAQAEQLRASLFSQQSSLVSARSQKQSSADALQQQIRAMQQESISLAALSSALEAKILASGGTGSGASASGLIWPANGPVTSPFGQRCFRGTCGFHPGIDIGVPYGTPIHAAAAGTVIWAAWMGGYGNLIVVDHGNGLATAYGHQSRLAVGNGARVSQGQVIGYVGCTGYCFGPHLHFEVRVNGKPVKPLAYLP